jgi:hypothetical protein
LRDAAPVDKFQNSNQYVWAKRYFQNSDLMALDTQCKIFHTFSPEVGERYLPIELPQNRMPYYTCMKKWFVSNFSIEKGRLYSRISDSWPCQAHFNGTSKFIIDFDIMNLVFSQIGDRRKARFIDGVTNTDIPY